MTIFRTILGKEGRKGGRKEGLYEGRKEGLYEGRTIYI
jgi:hypothetical protein